MSAHEVNDQHQHHEEPRGRLAPAEPRTFEEAFARLEEVIGRLEAGDAGLEEALALFEEGVTLARFCRRQLDQAEARIRVLVEGPAGAAEEADAPELEADLLKEAGEAE